MSSDQRKLGLALGSGAARGISHLGVLQALDEENITVHAISGCSIGAMVGASYAGGSVREFRDFLTTINWKIMASYFDFNFPQRGLLEGRKLLNLIEKLLPVHDFNQLTIPFRAIATDLATGDEVQLQSGNLVRAIRASMSLPGILVPFEIDGRYLVDGGLVNPIPVDVAYNMGAEVVIGVDLNHDLIRRNGRKKQLKAKKKSTEQLAKQNEPKAGSSWMPWKLEERYRILEDSVRQSVNRWFEDKEIDEKREPNIFDVLANSINIMEYQISRHKLEENQPDILIQPHLGYLNLFDYDEADATIREGYNRTMEHMDQIKALLFDPNGVR